MFLAFFPPRCCLWMRLELIHESIQLVVFLGCRLQLKEIALWKRAFENVPLYNLIWTAALCWIASKECRACGNARERLPQRGILTCARVRFAYLYSCIYGIRLYRHDVIFSQHEFGLNKNVTSITIIFCETGDFFIDWLINWLILLFYLNHYLINSFIH